MSALLPLAPEPARDGARRAGLDDIVQAALLDASTTDIHVAGGDFVWVRNRDGFRPYGASRVEQRDLVDWLAGFHHAYKALDLAEHLRGCGGDDDIGITVCGRRLRCNVHTRSGAIGLSMRRLADASVAFHALGLPPQVLTLADRSKGLFLVTGGTGSGKSTTLAALIHHLNETREAHIVTIEDPIEYVHRSRRARISQRAVGAGEGRDARSFGGALRAALRQDPDVIMIGEMRDRDTVSIAIEAAMTGHLVLGTLHTNTTYEAIDRIGSFFDGAERQMRMNVLAAVLNGIVSQLLLRDRTQALLVAAEVLVPTPAVRAHILKGQPHLIRQEMSTGSRDGQVLMNDALMALLRAQRVAPADALYASPDPEDLQRRLG